MAKKSSKKMWIWIGVFILLIGVLGALAYFNKRDSSTKVQVEKVSRRTITQTVSAIGKVQPETEVKISSEASGEIIFLGVKEGGAISKGQLLARIKPDLIQTQLDQYRASVRASQVGIEIAKVEVDRAESELKRVSALFQKEYSSKQDLEVAKAAYDRANGQFQTALSEKVRNEAALKSVEVSMSRTAIYAPISGTLTNLTVESGEKVVGTAQMQGTEMMRISDLSVMNAIVDVDENDVVKVKLGDTARVKIDAYPDRVFNGYVYEISHSPKQKGIGTQDEVIDFEVKIRILDREATMRPGMSCNVELETETHANVIAVPLQAVTIRTEDANKQPDANPREMTTEKVGDDKKKKNERPQQIVFSIENGKSKLRKIECGISDKGYIEVKQGLEEGLVIASGSYNTVSKILQDDMKIQIDSTSKKKAK